MMNKLQYWIELQLCLQKKSRENIYQNSKNKLYFFQNIFYQNIKMLGGEMALTDVIFKCVSVLTFKTIFNGNK